MRPYHGDRLAQHQSFTEDDWQFMAAMPLWLRIAPTWIVVHAGLAPGVPLAKQDPNHLVRIRYWNTAENRMLKLGDELATPETAAYWSTIWTGPDSVVYGHHPQRGGAARDAPTKGVLCLGIDTGCCFGHGLTAAIFVDGELRGTEAISALSVYCARGDEE